MKLEKLMFFEVFLLMLVFSPTLLAKPEINRSRLFKVAVDGVDVVAYFTQGLEPGKYLKGDKQFEFEWKGSKWRFSNKANLEKFKANPENFAPQYGGYCAYAVAKGSTASIDPAAWHIYNGKLYLNYGKRIQKRWLKDKDAYIKKANANWPAVLK